MDRHRDDRTGGDRLGCGFVPIVEEVLAPLLRGRDPDHPDKYADIGQVRAIRAEVVPAVRLRLDANQGWTILAGSMMEGPVGVGAAASLVAAYGTSSVSDLDAAWWLAASPVRGGPAYDGAYLVLPDEPGLGIGGIAFGE